MIMCYNKFANKIECLINFFDYCTYTYIRVIGNRAFDFSFGKCNA